MFSLVVSETVQQKQRIMLQCKLFKKLEIIIIAVQKGPNNETFQLAHFCKILSQFSKNLRTQVY